jgi:hypothetical protein
MVHLHDIGPVQIWLRQAAVKTRDGQNGKRI